MPVIQSSDKGTDWETKRNILLRHEEKKMYEEGERLGGGWREGEKQRMIICEGQDWLGEWEQWKRFGIMV